MLGLILPLATRLVGERFARAAPWAILAILAALIIGAAIWWIADTVDDARDEGVKHGVTAERVEAQGKVIENVAKAKAAAEAVRRDGGPSRDECMRDSRTPANC